MKYLSSKPFTAGANSKVFVDRWDETFGKKNPSTSAPDSIPERLCGTVENGSPCILRSCHEGSHYTEAEKAASQASIARREDERLDFLVGLKLESRDCPRPCDGDDDVASSKDLPPFSKTSLAKFERQAILAGLERRVKKVYLDRLSLTLTDEEILSLLLLLQDRSKTGPRLL